MGKEVKPKKRDIKRNVGYYLSTYYWFMEDINYIIKKDWCSALYPF